MKPLKTRKNPVAAAILAFMFGGIGLGIYLRSWRDFGVGLAISLGLSVLSVQAGAIGLLIVGLVLAAYAVVRVNSSNEVLERQSQAQPADDKTTFVPA
jgi:hypothetical protein